MAKVASDDPSIISLLVAVAGLMLAVVGLNAGPAIEVFPSIGADKISSDIDRAEFVYLVVDLDFEPDQFHRETLSELGVFSGTDRDDRSSLRLPTSLTATSRRSPTYSGSTRSRRSLDDHCAPR
jgi:hypothetical protein